MVFTHFYLPKGVFLKNIFRNLDVVTIGGAFSTRASIFFDVAFIFLFFYWKKNTPTMLSFSIWQECSPVAS
jgi:hypothetical protein